jgi:hypothetical protein
LYGTNAGTFYVGSNGYITFGAGDSDYTEDTATHFAFRRIAALYDDLFPVTGQVTWRQLGDRAAVTWQNVPEYGTSNTNNFQVELFTNGVIRITCLKIDATDGLIGLANGQGTPLDYFASDFSAYDVCSGLNTATVTIVAADANASEPGSDTGLFTVIRTGDTNSALTINYTIAGTASNGLDYGTLSGNVALAAGATNATITLTPLDDALIEGNETVQLVIVTGSGYVVGAPSAALVTIADDEPFVSITANDNSANETGPDAGQFTISRTGSTTGSLTVYYAITGTASNGDDYSSIPASATIPASSTSTNVTITPVDDAVVEGNETVTLTLLNDDPADQCDGHHPRQRNQSTTGRFDFQPDQRRLDHRPD